jgi:hypothetical protein
MFVTPASLADAAAGAQLASQSEPAATKSNILRITSVNTTRKHACNIDK